MKILVLGGTKFVGRTFAETALARGHQVTLFNRGLSGKGLFRNAVRLYGDRGVDLSALGGLAFDAVFDSSGYFPRHVQMAATLLEKVVGRYLFISSVSAYASFVEGSQNEDAALAEHSEDLPEEVTASSYGPLKVQCEKMASSILGSRATIVRPGLIVGPYDSTDRFTYWVVRFGEEGPVLVPEVKEQPVQAIDVRDLSEWCLSLLEGDVSGTFNAVAPPQPYRFGDVIEACAVGTKADLVWIPPRFLEEEGVALWTDLPFALDPDGSSHGLMQIDASRAIAKGLRFRSLGETIAETRSWAQSAGLSIPLKVGLSRDREARVIQKWRELNSSLPEN